MADSIGTIERQNCWLTMSDLFVDNEVDYRGIANSLVQHCPNMTDAELKRTYFDEVAPYWAVTDCRRHPQCGPDLMGTKYCGISVAGSHSSSLRPTIALPVVCGGACAGCSSSRYGRHWSESCSRQDKLGDQSRAEHGDAAKRPFLRCSQT